MHYVCSSTNKLHNEQTTNYVIIIYRNPSLKLKKIAHNGWNQEGNHKTVPFFPKLPILHQ